jgi:hypothetical protein
VCLQLLTRSCYPHANMLRSLPPQSIVRPDQTMLTMPAKDAEVLQSQIFIHRALKEAVNAEAMAATVVHFLWENRALNSSFMQVNMYFILFYLFVGRVQFINSLQFVARSIYLMEWTCCRVIKSDPTWLFCVRF